MILNKKIVFLTGTRADFGKIKSLIQILQDTEGFEPHIFITGMHLDKKYGYTYLEIEKSGFENLFSFSNATSEHSMDLTLAKTIQGFSNYTKTIHPDMIIVHGDRVEALAGAIVGSLNNILVAHIEGGEVSGTIDELIRHSVSKLSHLHFVSNELAKKRLIQMGELPDSIQVIGSPDVDIMFSNTLPHLEVVKTYYELNFEKYGVAMFHPVTTEYDKMEQYAHNFVEALLDSNLSYLVVYPNNDLGSAHILEQYKKLKNNNRFRVLPSLRFEYFLVLLKNADFMIGNSSAGVREAPYYAVPTINVGTRQHNRVSYESIINVGYESQEILNAITQLNVKQPDFHHFDFGKGHAADLFLQILSKPEIWKYSKQKQFLDI